MICKNSTYSFVWVFCVELSCLYKCELGTCLSKIRGINMSCTFEECKITRLSLRIFKFAIYFARNQLLTLYVYFYMHVVWTYWDHICYSSPQRPIYQNVVLKVHRNIFLIILMHFKFNGSYYSLISLKPTFSSRYIKTE